LEFIEKQVERDKKEKEENGGDNECEETEKLKEFVRESEDSKVKLDLKIFKRPEAPKTLQPPAKLMKLDISKSSKSSSSSSSSSSREVASTSRKSALDEIIEQEEKKKEKKNRKDYWLAEGIVVKIVTKSLGSDYYKQKAVVQEVIDKYRGKIKLLETGEKFKVDQEHLETVIPKIDGRVRILNGAYRECSAILKSLETDQFCATLEIDKGSFQGRIVTGIPYEDFSKIYEK
jgi:DNA/RNA-binding protein KIN17